jgi:GTP-binding protein Era
MNQKAAFIAICGAPNVGKSTLLNQLVSMKLSIVSPKVQTTRTTLKAIYTEGEAQLVFVDTPGIFKPKRSLEEAIVKTAWFGLQGIDLVLLVVDATFGLCENAHDIIKKLKANKIKPILLLNKADLITKEKQRRLFEEYKSSGDFKEVLAVSAMKNIGIKELLDYLISQSPEASWYFPDDQLTTESLRVLASEITREKLFLNLHDELPYNLTVETESWEDQPNGSVKIHQSIYVARSTHKQIILGAKGSMIKKIGTLARQDIETLVDAKVHLFLFVKIREDWVNDPERYSYLGMQFEKTKKNR